MIQLPPSKSIGARFLVATYFSGTLPADPLFEENEDLMVLQQALLEVYSDEEPIDFGDSPIDVGASGTALRFVTAVCASSPGADYVVAGTSRLMQRPMTPLLEILRQAGAGVQCLGENSSGPYRVKGNSLQGGNFSIRGDISSQFISALMLVAPSWHKGMNLSFTTPLVSQPYVEMTARLMEKFGIKVKLSDLGVEVSHGDYKEPKGFTVEADWSSASFFFEASAIGAEKIQLANLPSPDDSLQGDSAAAYLFAKLGVEAQFEKDFALLEKKSEAVNEFSADFRDCPDLLLPVAVAALCSGVKFRFVNIAHLRLKESDRIASLQTEAAKLGFSVVADENEIRWDGDTVSSQENPIIETHEDHRVAMSFAMAALKFGKIQIKNPRVVEKSFIDFWNQLPQVGLSCKEEDDIMTVTLIPENNRDN